MRWRGFILIATLLPLATVCSGWAANWYLPANQTNQPVWGIAGGLKCALPLTGLNDHAPRGLIRLYAAVLPEGGYDLINFLAIEPIVKGQRGLSELEFSERDQRAGKRLWLEKAPKTVKPNNDTEQIKGIIRIEKFQNGAHPYLAFSMSSEQPDEIKLTVFAEPDSAPMDFCIITATMGNKARTRCLWLKDEVVSSLKTYPKFQGNGFAPHRIFNQERLWRTATGDFLAAITTDEPEPASVRPFGKSPAWYYGGQPVTQYWRKPAGAKESLAVAVNGRYTYWMSNRPIPGGVAFENFEIQERFQNGQEYTFGITLKNPAQLGLKIQSP